MKTMTDMHQKVYRTGRESKRNGLSYWDNPWKHGTEAHEYWAKGWVAETYNQQAEKGNSDEKVS
jgi:hypothetical protein